MKARDGVILVLWAFCVGQLIQSWGGITPSLPFVKPAPTAVTYVYEKDDSAVPSAVLSALNTLNSQGIVATFVDDDVKDGDGETPDQYKAAFLAVANAGSAALVVTARNGDEVLKVLPDTKEDPLTEADVLGAVK